MIIIYEYNLNESFSNNISNNENEEDQYIELDNLKDKNESNFRNEKSIDDLFLKQIILII